MQYALNFKPINLLGREFRTVKCVLDFSCLILSFILEFYILENFYFIVNFVIFFYNSGLFCVLYFVHFTVRIIVHIMI